ncbi:MAG TPA: AarF/UbiB family protein [Ktedonobacteraceae bacterium]|nr:AarF/UbiB family protein [Ktedonobacteraceae bacterium]
MKKMQHVSSLGTMMKAYLANQFTCYPARCAEIIHIFGKYQLYHVITQLGTLHHYRGKSLPEDIHQEHCLYAENVARAFEELGTCFIKLGQMLSTRSDLLPAPYTVALSRLQHTIAPVPGSQIAKIIEADLGASIADLFCFFDFEPVATASIAQVHKALLHDGSSVAIKVQRPGVQQQVEADIEILLAITRFISKHTVLKFHSNLVSSVQEMKQSLLQELDFVQEANNTITIGQDLQGFQHLTTPTIFSAYSSHQVLTLSFITGRHLAQITNDELGSFAPATIAKELLFAYLKQIVINGVFHCDPHPGNLLLTDDGRLALLDFGMVGRLNERQIENLLLLLLAFSERQGERVADTYLEMVDIPKNFDKRAFTQKICELVCHYYDHSKQGVEIGRALLDLVKIASTYHISIPRNFALLGKALLNLDGTLYRLSPDLNLIQMIRYYLPQVIQQRILSQISPGKSIVWLLDAKHLIENTLQKSDALLGKLASEEFVTSRQIEHLDKSIRRASLRLSLGMIVSSLAFSLALLLRAKKKQH